MTLAIPTDLAALATLGPLAPAPDGAAAAAALARQGQLTKPAGSLGRLEQLAVWLAGWQRRPVPRLDRVHVLICAGNHGVAARGVSAFPAAVTAQMVANFAAGGAAINQLSALAGATLDVLALDLARPTADFTQGPAMSAAECLAAVQAGWHAVPDGIDLLAVGEMGIANTTVAAALSAALLGGDGASWVGRGTGVDGEGLARKAAAVDAGLALHGPWLADPVEVLRRLGGRELAAMVGAILVARMRGVPVVLDGFVSTASALVVRALGPGLLDHALAGHCSAEQGHRRQLVALGLQPLLDLGLRLGEGSGAALAVPILRAALAVHGGMATFAEAGVSGED
ncbi:nicotinate-nucleotide--dimethylbenzimidazole phosphoribosyltransferase [Zavarzinia sp. CC-PAN008]|uniref:nicotinate-nucleotide--dimethylbenzimidazole phosphoribosyltransferase n=1 Tax=Zavarzinia sp. CC-PAN008 TaxID=3243332 RepID=UPI003F744FD2